MKKLSKSNNVMLLDAASPLMFVVLFGVPLVAVIAVVLLVIWAVRRVRKLSRAKKEAEQGGVPAAPGEVPPADRRG